MLLLIKLRGYCHSAWLVSFCPVSKPQQLTCAPKLLAVLNSVAEGRMAVGAPPSPESNA
jgi:hypothetical protein